MILLGILILLVLVVIAYQLRYLTGVMGHILANTAIAIRRQKSE